MMQELCHYIGLKGFTILLIHMLLRRHVGSSGTEISDKEGKYFRKYSSLQRLKTWKKIMT